MMTCDHKHYIAAGYLESRDGVEDIRVQTLYDVFCLDCQHYINLLSGVCIDDKGLTNPQELRERQGER